jgi:hypothetical protein
LSNGIHPPSIGFGDIRQPSRHHGPLTLGEMPAAQAEGDDLGEHPKLSMIDDVHFLDVIWFAKSCSTAVIES